MRCQVSGGSHALINSDQPVVLVVLEMSNNYYRPFDTWASYDRYIPQSYLLKI